MDEVAYTKSLFKEAEAFCHQYYAEESLGSPFRRLEEIRRAIDREGTYAHTFKELEYGAKLAWRNNNRCIGRLFWKTLKVLDQRHLKTEEEIFGALVDHLTFATNGGEIRSAITVFRPADPLKASAIHLRNTHLIRYAGYPHTTGIIGDPDQVTFTDVCQQLGWRGKGTPFDLLPLILQVDDRAPQCFELAPEHVLEVDIRHPTFSWFEELQLKWHALPVISNMSLEVGGIRYTAAPFNGWYMATEIAARNFGDTRRYNVLPQVAKRMGLETSDNATLWKDKALVELNLAVLDSFRQSGVSIVDHHSASEQFMHFAAAEEKQGRKVTGDWTWLVPPMAGSTTELFHREWNNEVKSPNYVYNPSSEEGSRAK